MKIGKCPITNKEVYLRQSAHNMWGWYLERSDGMILAAIVSLDGIWSNFKWVKFNMGSAFEITARMMFLQYKYFCFSSRTDWLKEGF